MTATTALHGLIGSALIGAGAAVLLLLNGHTAGVSGVLASAARPNFGEQGWRLAFLAGLVVAAPGYRTLRSLAVRVG